MPFNLKSLTRGISKSWNRNSGKPLLGTAIQNKLKTQPLTMLSDARLSGNGDYGSMGEFIRNSGKKEPLLYNLYNKAFRGKVHFTATGRGLQRPAAQNGIVMAPRINFKERDEPLSRDLTNPKGRYKIDPKNVVDLYKGVDLEKHRFDKFDESKLIYGDKAKPLDSLISPENLTRENLANTLNQHYGSAWMLKNRNGINSRVSGNSVYRDVNDIQDINGLRNTLSDYYVEPRQNLMRAGLLERGASNLAEKVTGAMGTRMGMDKLHESIKGSNIGSKEMRVHVVNGKIVPYATMDRGTPVANLISQFNPLNRNYVNSAESEVGKMLKRLPKHMQDKNFGFDVAFDAKTRRAHVIETNPASFDASGANQDVGTSGFLNNPLVMDAIQASIRGELPMYMKARRAALATGAVGAGVGGYYGYRHLTQPPTPTQPQAV